MRHHPRKLRGVVQLGLRQVGLLAARHGIAVRTNLCDPASALRCITPAETAKGRRGKKNTKRRANCNVFNKPVGSAAGATAWPGFSGRSSSTKALRPSGARGASKATSRKGPGANASAWNSLMGGNRGARGSQVESSDKAVMHPAATGGRAPRKSGARFRGARRAACGRKRARDANTTSGERSARAAPSLRQSGGKRPCAPHDTCTGHAKKRSR